MWKSYIPFLIRYIFSFSYSNPKSFAKFIDMSSNSHSTLDVLDLESGRLPEVPSNTSSPKEPKILPLT